MKKLAIIIPAYKNDFISKTLKSLSKQTNKNFTVYIGIDASPYEFDSIIAEYNSDIDIITKRFDDNLGGNDLVSQWKRCIDMSVSEPWIWLFSDDDMIGDYCVELFYKAINEHPNFDLYHFNVKIIEESDVVVKNPTKYPSILNAKSFYKWKMRGRIESFVVEYIFSRDIYEKTNGFISFPMAWGSDTATWVSMSRLNGIKTIPGDYVYWRRSSKNITPDKNVSVVQKKLLADVAMINWVRDFLADKSIIRFNRYAFFLLYFHYSDILSFNKIALVLNEAVRLQIISSFEKMILSLLYPFLSVVRRLKSLINN